MMITTSYLNSKINKNEITFTVPLWILDDVGYFYPEIYYKIISENNMVANFDIIYIDEFIQLRKQIYWLCNWYTELINANIPVIKSDIYCINNNPETMKQILKDNIIMGENKFIRFCNASPKDIVNPIFEADPNQIVNIFQTSNRTNYMFDSNHQTHVVIRPIVQIDHEVRCFWHNHKLRAISGPEYYINDIQQDRIKNMINNFFELHGEDIAFNSATLDIGIYNDSVFIIEINSFGSDMLAGAGHYNWTTDFMILYNADKPVYKFKSEFEW